METCADRLFDEIKSWGRGEAVAAVLDTNVLLKFGTGLNQVDWSVKLKERRNVPIVLVIPVKAIDELDNLKNRGTSEQRTLARLALRRLEANFE